MEEIIPKLCVNRFASDVEILTALNAKNLKIKEIPVTLIMDDSEKSTVTVEEITHMFLDTCGIAYRKYFKGWYN